MKDKPTWMSDKDWMVKKLSVEMKLSEALVERVIKHQADSIISAMQTNNSVEMSGFGKFIFNSNKAQRKLNRMDGQIMFFRKSISESDNEKKIEEWNNTIDEMLIRRKILMKRLNNELDADFRRLEKQPSSKKGTKG